MAGKSRRVASRQGELSRRRKRGQRGPSGTPATGAPPVASENGGAAAVAVEAAGNTAAAATEAPAGVSPKVASAPRRAVSQTPAQTRGRVRPRGERPAAYNYVGAELRRIGILSTVVVAALIVIAVVL